MSKPNEKPMTYFTADVLLGNVLALRVDGVDGAGPDGTLSASQRLDLLKQVRAGEFTGPLLVDATTFVQRLTPNRNFSRFARGTLRSGARSFVGQVVLLDHDQRSQQARIGTIVKSAASKDDEGNVTFVQTLSIVKQHAIESVLDGTIDRFSIGWYPSGPVVCSVHNQPLYGADCCPCWPGQTVNGKLVEAVFTAWEGVEVSAVNVPAVVGTGIDQIRAALTALRAEHQPTQNKETKMNFRSFLGLADTATDDEVQAALTARNAADKERSDRLAALEGQAQQNEQALIASRQLRLDTAIAAAKSDGRLFIARDSSGKEVASELETRVRNVAKADVDSAIGLLDAMPKSHPNGNPAALQSSAPAAPAPKSTGGVQMTNALENMMPLMGLDAKDVQDFGPQHRQTSAKDAPVPRHLTKLFTTRHMGNR